MQEAVGDERDIRPLFREKDVSSMSTAQRALLRVSGWVLYEDLRAEIAAELALQSGPQPGEGRALGVLRSRLLRLVLLDHDQPVVPLAGRRAQRPVRGEPG